MPLKSEVHTEVHIIILGADGNYFNLHGLVAGQTFAHKMGRSGDIRIPVFVTLPESGKDQSDQMGYRVHSKLR